MAPTVLLDPPNTGGASTDVYAAQSRSGVGVVVKTLLILVLWAAAFVAFLMAPLITLGVAWLVAMVVLALRERGRAPRHDAAPAPRPHRFGARRDPEVTG